jgi:hypothetical protein
LQKVLSLSTDTNGEVKAAVLSAETGQTTVTAKTTFAGQFRDFFGVVGGVPVSGIKAGVESASVSFAFQPSAESLLYAQEAVDAANQFIDAAEPLGTSKEGLAALDAANVVARLEVEVNDLIDILKKQIELLNAFVLKIKAKG